MGRREKERKTTIVECRNKILCKKNFNIKFALHNRRCHFTVKKMHFLFVSNNSSLDLFLCTLHFRAVQPQCLGVLMVHFSESLNTTSRSNEQDEIINLNNAYVFAAGIILCACISVIIRHPFVLWTSRLGISIRLTCVSLIYRKVNH